MSCYRELASTFYSWKIHDFLSAQFFLKNFGTNLIGSISVLKPLLDVDVGVDVGIFGAMVWKFFKLLSKFVEIS